MRIEVGDMVQLVWGCCWLPRHFLGETFIVAKIEEAAVICPVCGYVSRGRHGWVRVDAEEGISLRWLIKVEPPRRAGLHLVHESEQGPVGIVAAKAIGLGPMERAQGGALNDFRDDVGPRVGPRLPAGTGSLRLSRSTRHVWRKTRVVKCGPRAALLSPTGRTRPPPGTGQRGN